MATAIPRTMILAFSAIFLAAILGIALGVVAALNQNSWFDHLAVTTSVAGISLPSYVSAMILALVFGYYLSDYTGLGVRGSIYDLDDFGDEAYFGKT